jgi:hypothetical protein
MTRPVLAAAVASVGLACASSHPLPIPIDDGGSNADGQGDAAAPDVRCIDNLACVAGTRWDGTACQCVPTADGGSGTGCSYGGQAYPEGSTFPAIDGCNTCTCASAQAVCSKRPCPAPDAAVGDGPSGVCRLDEQLTFGVQGAFINFRDESTLTPDGLLRIRRMYLSGPRADGPIDCSGQLACNPDIAGVRAGLQHPDVQQALAQPQPPRYGQYLPDVGTFVLRTSSGRGFDVEAREPIPAGIAALRDLLREEASTVAASPACASLR